MKVIMLCPALREGVGKYFNMPEASLSGWISGAIEGIQKYDDISLSFAAFQEGKTSSIETKEVDGITYYLVKYHNEAILDTFFREHKFDIYHLYGAENAFSHTVFPFLPIEKALVYIQGIMSEHVYHYKANCDEFNNTGYLFNKYLDMNLNLLKKQADKEIDIFKKAKYIAGRTEWDRAFLYRIHSNAKYYYLSETLRDIFYVSPKWDADKMKEHTIFVTQAGYPVKAAHMIVEVVRILKSYYSDIKCTICGTNLMDSSSLATKLGVSYASFIQKLIKKYDLQDNILFVGSKSGKEVADMMILSNVFLSASSIENSPNSLQEAMLLGMPCVSSFVGGVNTLVDSNDEVVMYPFDDPMRAAYEISKIFEDKEYAKKLSSHAIKRAEVLTDKEANAKALYDIYCDMIAESKMKGIY